VPFVCLLLAGRFSYAADAAVLDADKGDDLFRAEPSPGTQREARAVNLPHAAWPFSTANSPQHPILSTGLLNSVRRSNLDRYIVNLKQKAREGAGKRAGALTNLKSTAINL
jgi:hypothetical protein